MDHSASGAPARLRVGTCWWKKKQEKKSEFCRNCIHIFNFWSATQQIETEIFDARFNLMIQNKNQILGTKNKLLVTKKRHV